MDGNAWRIEVQAPQEIHRLVVPKGSITISGVSLTVNAVTGDRFDVAVIPFTGGKTLLTKLAVGDRVNLEADIIGKYVARLLHGGDSGSAEEMNMDMLRRHGFA
jgi:riboflavin synthase